MRDKIPEIVARYSCLDDWQDRYRQLIDEGRRLDSLPEELKLEENLVKGCSSQVWVIVEDRESRLYIKADSDSILAKGMISLPVQVADGEDIEYLSTWDPIFLVDLGLYTNLTPMRSNGLYSMVQHIKAAALRKKVESSLDSSEGHE